MEYWHAEVLISFFSLLCPTVLVASSCKGFLQAVREEEHDWAARAGCGEADQRMKAPPLLSAPCGSLHPCKPWGVTRLCSDMVPAWSNSPVQDL